MAGLRVDRLVTEGIGIDLVDVEKIREHSKSVAFMNKVFTPDEVAFFQSKKDPIPHIATTFAAKEAVFKALGLGWENGREVEIARDVNNRPYIVLRGRLKRFAKGKNIQISVTYDNNVAAAIALVEGKSR